MAQKKEITSFLIAFEKKMNRLLNAKTQSNKAKAKANIRNWIIKHQLKQEAMHGVG